MITYDFHPEVRRDLDEIWDFIGADNPEAADRLIAKTVDATAVPRRGGQQAARGHQINLTTDNIRFTVYPDD
jgi:plasmid stabilization system protein ParE